MKKTIPNDIKLYLKSLYKQDPGFARQLAMKLHEGVGDDEERNQKAFNKIRNRNDYTDLARTGGFGPDVQKYQEELLEAGD